MEKEELKQSSLPPTPTFLPTKLPGGSMGRSLPLTVRHAHALGHDSFGEKGLNFPNAGRSDSPAACALRPVRPSHSPASAALRSSVRLRQSVSHVPVADAPTPLSLVLDFHHWRL